MIAYTITAPLANGTSAVWTASNSGSNSVSQDEIQGLFPTQSGSTEGSGNNGQTTYNDGQQVTTGSGIGKDTQAWAEFFGDEKTYYNSGTQSFGKTINAAGDYIQNEAEAGGFTRSIRDGNESEAYTESGASSQSGHIMAVLTAAPEGGGAGFTNRGANGTNTYSQARYFNTIALQTTTQTTVTNNYKITTTTQEKLAKVGTTITQSVGTSVVTLPTTTNAKSWTENTTTNTTATEDATAVTTSRGINSYWKKTAHTVYILGKGETTAFLKSNAALNATNGGPTDTAAYDTYSGPTTFTITRAAGRTSQKPVVADTATDIGFEAGEASQTTVTNRWIVAANSTGIYYYPGYPHHFPLSSTNITIQTGASESSTTQVGNKQGEGQWGANAKTTTCSAWGQTSVTYSLAGVSYTEGIPTYTQETYAQPIVRSGSGSYQNDGPTLDEDGNEVTGITQAGGGANGFGEQANYFVNFQNQGRQNNGGGADAFYGLAYAWGTLGGTTAEPYQSISVNGIASSESVTWPFVSISAGVQTPKPFVTVSQKPETSATSSTAATKTEATTRRIWGVDFAKTTSSRQTAATTSGTTITGTSGSTTTPIEAGGAAITSFQLGGARGFPINQLAGGWIPAPAMFVVGGIAQTNDSTAIIPPGEYANSTITAPKSFSGSSIANTFFEPKAAVTYLCSPS
jgi:hypothetical protein